LIEQQCEGLLQFIIYYVFLLGLGEILIKRYGRKTDKRCHFLSQEKKLVKVCKIINAELFQDQAPFKLCFY